MGSVYGLSSSMCVCMSLRVGKDARERGRVKGTVRVRG